MKIYIKKFTQDEIDLFDKIQYSGVDYNKFCEEIKENKNKHLRILFPNDKI